jgi:adenylate cyclase
MGERVDRINSLLVRAAASADFGAAFAGSCEELVAAGVPLWRASLAHPMLDPVVRARSNIWRRERAVARESTTHDDGERQFRVSPIRHLQDSGKNFCRWRLERGEGSGFPLLRTLRESGGTDYLLHLVGMEQGIKALAGVAVSFATDRPGGFADPDLSEIAAVIPALAMTGSHAALAEITASLLDLYLGPSTARQVLRGEIRRGFGRRIEAAILLADLRGFTQITERADPLQVVAWLDEHLEQIAVAVAAAGGEILKFLGDGLLAVFAVEPEALSAEACARALAAAEAALSANQLLNAARETRGGPALGLDIALHYGEVVYGNVGSLQRLDFTVIGRAVNEASRIEALCTALGRSLLLSREFAQHCGRPTVNLGFHALRGVDQPREIRAVR